MVGTARLASCPDFAMRGLLLIAAILPCLLPLCGCQQQVVTDLPAAAAAAIPNNPPPAAVDPGPANVTWDQLDIGIRAESVYEPWMMKTSIQVLDDQPVRITGYMHGGVAVKEGIREFVLLRNIDCPFGRQGEAHHVMLVKLADDLRTSFSQRPLTLEGKFHIRPYNGPDGTTWALYALDEARLSTAATPPSPGQNSIHQQDGAAP